MTSMALDVPPASKFRSCLTQIRAKVESEHEYDQPLSGAAGMGLFWVDFGDVYQGVKVLRSFCGLMWKVCLCPQDGVRLTEPQGLPPSWGNSGGNWLNLALFSLTC